MEQNSTNFLAADLGASNGRVLLARWNGEQFGLDVVHRFPNGPVAVPGRELWDVLRLWAEIKEGMARYVGDYGGAAASFGVDTWGVDFGLFDSTGQLLGTPVHYRDVRTVGVPELAFNRVSRADIFAETGIQFLGTETHSSQLYAMRIHGEPQFGHGITTSADARPLPLLDDGRASR